MADADWFWVGEEERWRVVHKWQCWTPTSGRRRWVSDGRWRESHIILSVAGSPNFRNASLCACAGRYALKVTALRDAIADYLEKRPIRVYGGFEDENKWSEITHPDRPFVDIEQIDIPDVSQPKRVHVYAFTCYPDPYYVYELIFEERVIVEARGGFW